MQPIVSVIIPTFNSAEYIGKAVESFLNQTCKDVELIVVDDGSTDSTQQALGQFSGKIQLVTQKNRGPAAARNVGLNIASGKYVVFLDSDDQLLPEMLAHQSSWLEAHPEIGLVYSNGYRLIKILDRDLKVPLSLTGYLRPIPPGKNPFDYLVPRNCFPIDVAMTRLAILKEVGGFDESLTALEDWDLWYRVTCQTPIFFLDEAVAYYRVRKASNSGDHRRNNREYLHVMEKIEKSAQFFQSSRKTRAEFYYLKGLQNLFLGNASITRICYQKALLLNPFHLRLFIGNVLFSLLGQRIVNLYQTKRNMATLRIFLKK